MGTTAIGNLFTESELRLLLLCLDLWSDERSREAIARVVEIKNLRRKLEIRILEGQ
jgi:hypothetical protein